MLFDEKVDNGKWVLLPAKFAEVADRRAAMGFLLRGLFNATGFSET